MEENTQKIYRSPDEAYPFLSEKPDCLLCDFEILTDEIASLTGLLAQRAPEEFRGEIYKTEELIYHLNPSLRTFFSVTQEECQWLEGRYHSYKNNFPQVRFVLPAGGEAACTAHLIRVKCKELVRLMYRIAYREPDRKTAPEVFDFANLLSNYFFYLALELNRYEGRTEVEFVSRNYK